MICLDNSEWMRNGDYIPTRLEAQQDAASLICTARTDSHPENTVGLLTMAGKGVDMLVSPTENIGKILAAFAGITAAGNTQFSTSVQIAQLALKHRKNKNGGQRIIIFVGSPIKEEQKDLRKIGLLLKKNNIAVDVVIMGEHSDIQDKLTEFVQAANSNDNSHLIVVPPGVLPSDALITSPIFQGDDGGLAQAMAASASDGGVGRDSTGGGAFAEYGGIDPSLDPELAMAIRISAEEARTHEESQRAESGGNEESKNNESTSGQVSSSASSGDGNVEDEDALLQAALALSMQDSGSSAPSGDTAAEPVSSQGASAEGGEDEHMNEEEGDDDDALQMALQMSMAQSSSAEQNSVADSSGGEGGNVLDDPSFVNQLLGSVGVDQNDPLMQAALQQLANSGRTDDKRPSPDAGKDDEGNDSKKRKE